VLSGVAVFVVGFVGLAILDELRTREELLLLSVSMFAAVQVATA